MFLAYEFFVELIFYYGPLIYAIHFYQNHSFVPLYSKYKEIWKCLYCLWHPDSPQNFQVVYLIQYGWNHEFFLMLQSLFMDFTSKQNWKLSFTAAWKMCLHPVTAQQQNGKESYYHSLINAVYLGFKHECISPYIKLEIVHFPT